MWAISLNEQQLAGILHQYVLHEKRFSSVKHLERLWPIGEYIHQIVNDQRILNTPWANIRPIFHLWWPLMKIHSKNQYLILVRSKPVLLITIFLFLYSRNLPNVGSTYIVSLKLPGFYDPFQLENRADFPTLLYQWF